MLFITVSWKGKVCCETIPIRVTDEGMTVRHPGGRPVRVALRWNDQQAFLNHLEDRLAGPESATAEPGTRN